MKRDYGEIKYSILSILAVTGMILVVLAAPNLLQIFGMVEKFSKTRNDNFRRSLKTLHKKRLINVNKGSISITKAGLTELDKLKIKQITLNKNKDGKTRLVIFDVPVQQNRSRDLFTHKLKDLEFKYFQKSVWATNCDCEKEVLKVAKILKIEKYIKIFTVIV